MGGNVGGASTQNTVFYELGVGRWESGDVCAKLPTAQLNYCLLLVMFFLFHLLRLVVALKARAVAAIVFAFEEEAAFQRRGSESPQNQ